MGRFARLVSPGTGKTGDRLRLMRGVAVATFMAGGLTCASGVLTTESTHAARLGQGACAVAFVAFGVLLVALRPRQRVIEWTVAASILTLGVLVARSEPLGMAPLFFLWPVVYAAYFFSVRLLVTLYVWMAVNLGVGLLLNPHLNLKVDTFTGTASSVGVMAALIAFMTRREAQLRCELARAAETDALTGLLNRRAFDPLLGEMIEHAAKASAPLSVVMFDVDHFKALNDLHGHLAGDDALRRIADLLVYESRGTDAVGRLGGEEFAVALPGTDIADARLYADRVAAQLWHPTDPLGPALSISAGITAFRPGANAHSLLSRADEALYAAKRAGRARTAWWDDGVVVGEPYRALRSA
ncbi:MAG: GGDEF domain-containing protein [Acidobacteriota bacterium]|nr:GGDEF domain-containing protein [Acidobacteriota bacterium]